MIVEDGKRRQLEHYTARMPWMGKRQSFPLGSGNPDAASTKAVTIYKSLQIQGWEKTLKIFSLTHAKPERETVLTVCLFLEEVGKVATIRPRTLADYMRTFRRIVTDLEGIKEDTDHDGKKKSRFNYRSGGGRETWVERVDAVKLASITTARIYQWKIAFVNRALGAGLRRGEINALLWRQVDFDRGVIRIEITEAFSPKTSKSTGDVEIDVELVAILRGYP